MKCRWAQKKFHSKKSLTKKNGSESIYWAFHRRVIEQYSFTHLRSYDDDESDIRYDWERGRQDPEPWSDNEARWEDDGGRIRSSDWPV